MSSAAYGAGTGATIPTNLSNMFDVIFCMAVLTVLWPTTVKLSNAYGHDVVPASKTIAPDGAT
jgi:hypothetical protein